EKQYHIFSQKKKWFVVAMVGATGTLSVLTPYIYLPLLVTIAKEFNLGLGSVALTISLYFIFQGIFAMFWDAISDTFGRRPTYIYSIFTFLATNIILSFSPNFAILLVFRGIQAAGIASVVSMGNGVILDMTPLPEADNFFKAYQGVRNASMVFGPLLGGALSNSLGFRSIFVLLLVLSSTIFVLLLLSLPETLRSVAGNGSVDLHGIHEPLLSKFNRWKGNVNTPPCVDEGEEDCVRPKVSVRMFLEPLLLLNEKDILLSLLFAGVTYAAWGMVLVSTAGLFNSVFGLNDLFLGLAFIPNGLGAMVGSAVMGNVLERDFLEACSKHRAVHSLPPTFTLSRSSLPADFPLERSRLARLPWVTMLFILSICFYGFSLASPSLTKRQGWIVLPLLLQFLIAVSTTSVCAIHQTLVSDLCPRQGASSAAVNNLMRCSFAAVGVALIQKIIKGAGVGPAFVALGFVIIILMPLPVLQWYFGSEWRRAR
ncbi:MFS general substrate transporter, partial [Lindgomyces ingoldianus]